MTDSLLRGRRQEAGRRGQSVLESVEDQPRAKKSKAAGFRRMRPLPLIASVLLQLCLVRPTSTMDFCSNEIVYNDDENYPMAVYYISILNIQLS